MDREIIDGTLPRIGGTHDYHQILRQGLGWPLASRYRQGGRHITPRLVRTGTYYTPTGRVPVYRQVEPPCKYPRERLRQLRAERGVGKRRRGNAGWSSGSSLRS